VPDHRWRRRFREARLYYAPFRRRRAGTNDSDVDEISDKSAGCLTVTMNRRAELRRDTSTRVRSPSIWQFRPGEMQMSCRDTAVGQRVLNYMAFQYFAIPSSETEGADRPRGCVFQCARRRPAPGVGSRTDATPLRKGSDCVGVTELVDCNHIAIGHWNSLGHSMITNTRTTVSRSSRSSLFVRSAAPNYLASGRGGDAASD